MVQKIEEQDGYMLLYFGEPPADVEKLRSSIVLHIKITRYCSANGVITTFGRCQGGAPNQGKQLKTLHTENFWKKQVQR